MTSKKSEVKEVNVKKKVVGISKDAKLTVVVDSNPKRVGSASYDRFQGYLENNPKTVADALDAGLIMGDIAYDFIRGYIEVEGASVEEYTPTPRSEKADVETEVETDAAGY